MKIVCIVGICHFVKRSDILWDRLHAALREAVPNAECVLEPRLYFPWQKKKLVRYADDIIKKYDTGEDLMLLGYSLGGIIACASAPRFTKSRVLLVATIGAPHKITHYYRWLGATPKPLPMPVLSFAGVLDPVVLSILTRYPESVYLPLLSDHVLFFFLSNHPARIVARNIAHTLAKLPRAPRRNKKPSTT